jgi:hypothetical protein
MDYRKWLAFNTELSGQQIVSDLHYALKKKKSKGKVSFTLSSSAEGHWYTIETIPFSEQLILPVDQGDEFIGYLEKHYLPSGEQTPVYVSTVTSASNCNTGESKPIVDSFLPPWIRNLFFDSSIPRHVRGYVLIGILVVQIFILPQFFDTKLPDGVQWAFITICLALSHFAVRNYKTTILTGGIRYKIVFRITTWLCGLLFLFIALENVVGDFLSESRSFTIFSAAAISILLVLGGVFIGWLLSVVVYFSNGGKMVTDPTKVNYKTL